MHGRRRRWPAPEQGVDGPPVTRETRAWRRVGPGTTRHDGDARTTRCRRAAPNGVGRSHLAWVTMAAEAEPSRKSIEEGTTPMSEPYLAAADRYDDLMPYRRTGRSGLHLPVVALGHWHNFGDGKDFDTQRAVVRRAFDLGVTHFDLANNYGPPAGSAETNFGRLLREDLKAYRDEIVIATKAGYFMHPGPYGDWGSRKYLL